MSDIKDDDDDSTSKVRSSESVLKEMESVIGEVVGAMNKKRKID